ncbi:MAG TPA: zinc-dependent metalloprotease family protein [Tepidisphaeraceae bacterium]|nr:zinc-dependent metalloprotease family protein [Tepidisphaeraceae bacterium]
MIQRKNPSRSRSPRAEPLEPRRLLAANPTIIDLLVLYTTQAKTDQGGDASIQSEIQGVVTEVNVAMQNSQIPITIRLVHSQELTGYTGSGSVATDEMRLKAGTGAFSSVPALRNTWGADLVDLVTTGNDNAHISPGQAEQMTHLSPVDDTLAYSAIDESVLGPSNATFAHEIGHNLGAAHARGDNSAPPGPFDYDYGYRFQGNNGVFYDDIMSIAQPGDVSIPYYSNPNIAFQGQPIGKPVGDPNEADLAAAFPLTAPIVAGYRTTNVVPDTTAPIAQIYQMNPSGQTLTFTIRYRDDEAVDASTISASNIAVATPEGFIMTPELLSVTGGTGNSFQKFATYRVTLPTATEPLSGIQISVKANQVKDINGHFTPAGQLTWVTDETAADIFAAARDLGVAPSNVIVQDSVSNSILDSFDFYSFTLTSPQTVDLHLTNLNGGGAGVGILQDTNNNGKFDPGTDSTTYAPANNGTTDRTIAQNLAAGQYYIQVINTPSGGAYSLNLTTFTDTTPPAATMDSSDVITTNATVEKFAITYRDDHDLDGASVLNSAIIDVHVHLDSNFDFTSSFIFPEPNQITGNNANSLTLIYDYTRNFTASDNGTYTVVVHDSGAGARVHDVAGNNIPLTATIGSFHIEVGTVDTTPPTVLSVVANPVIVPGASTYAFNVTYDDNIALNTNTLDGSDLRITGPNGFSQLASFVSVTPAPTVGAKRTATYQITTPGGSWDDLDDGAYTITLQSGQVKDTATNAAVGGAIGSFNVHVPFPGDASGDDRTNLLDLNALATNFGKQGRGYAQGDFNYDGVVNMTDFNTLAANFNKSLPPASAPPVLQSASVSNSLFSDVSLPASDWMRDVLSQAV